MSLEGNSGRSGQYDRYLEQLENLPPDVVGPRPSQLAWRRQLAGTRRCSPRSLDGEENELASGRTLRCMRPSATATTARLVQLAGNDIDTWRATSSWLERRTAANGMIVAWQLYSTARRSRLGRWWTRSSTAPARECSLGAADSPRSHSEARIGLLRAGIPESAVMVLRHVGVIARQLGNPGLPGR